MAFLKDPLIVWKDLRNRVSMPFYMDPGEEEIVETVFLMALGVPSVAIVNPDGATGTPCIIQLAGDWAIPVEIAMTFELDVTGNAAAAYIPAGTNPVTCAADYAAYLNGNPAIRATSKGSEIRIYARHDVTNDSVCFIPVATPVYVPPA